MARLPVQGQIARYDRPERVLPLTGETSSLYAELLSAVDTACVGETKHATAQRILQDYFER